MTRAHGRHHAVGLPSARLATFEAALQPQRGHTARHGPGMADVAVNGHMASLRCIRLAPPHSAEKQLYMHCLVEM